MFALYAPRIALRRMGDKEYWRAKRPKFVSAGILFTLLAALYQLFANDAFYVPRLTVVGNYLLPPGEIEAAGGISGWNIFFVNDKDVASAINKLPEVRNAQVKVELPNQVIVQLTERLPRFVWVTRSGAYWVDDDGIALRARFNAPDLLTLKDVDAASVKLGDRVNAEAFNAAVSLRNLWPDGPKAFEWSKAHGLAIRDSHGWLVYFGSASQMGDKLAALKIVTSQLERTQRTIAYIDVGNGLPYYQEVVTKN